MRNYWRAVIIKSLDELWSGLSDYFYFSMRREASIVKSWGFMSWTLPYIEPLEIGSGGSAGDLFMIEVICSVPIFGTGVVACGREKWSSQESIFLYYFAFRIFKGECNNFFFFYCKMPSVLDMTWGFFTYCYNIAFLYFTQDLLVTLLRMEK